MLVVRCWCIVLVLFLLFGNSNRDCDIWNIEWFCCFEFDCECFSCVEVCVWKCLCGSVCVGNEVLVFCLVISINERPTSLGNRDSDSWNIEWFCCFEFD